MQATSYTYDPETRGGSVPLDDGTPVSSTPRPRRGRQLLLRPGQRVRIEGEGEGRPADHAGDAADVLETVGRALRRTGPDSPRAGLPGREPGPARCERRAGARGSLLACGGLLGRGGLARRGLLRGRLLRRGLSWRARSSWRWPWPSWPGWPSSRPRTSSSPSRSSSWPWSSSRRWSSPPSSSWPWPLRGGLLAADFLAAAAFTVVRAAEDPPARGCPWGLLDGHVVLGELLRAALPGP